MIRLREDIWLDPWRDAYRRTEANTRRLMEYREELDRPIRVRITRDIRSPIREQIEEELNEAKS